MSAKGPWTRPQDLVATLRRRWERGHYLRAYARDEPWVPITVALKGPSADDVLRDSARVVAWTDAIRRAAIDRRGQARFAIEYRTVRSRVLGDNLIPARIRLDSLAQLADLLGTGHEIERLDDVVHSTRCEVPAAATWVADHPLEALAHHDVWGRLLATVKWIASHDASTLDLRHLDVPGVDTKFVEHHRKVLTRLLDEVLPASRIDSTAKDFARRYGFRARPRYVRLRLLSPVPTLPAQLTELELRADELANLPLPVTTVFVVENKASYLALPDLPDAVALFGGGYAVPTLELVPWLGERDLVYWGDIDTHGFAILDRLRERVPSARSILMDRSTLIAHRNQLTDEPTPTNAVLTHLTEEEASMYRDLVEDRYGEAIRLEQERVRFAFVRRALKAWSATMREHV